MTTRLPRITRRTALALTGAALAAPALTGRARAAEATLRLHHMLPPVAFVHKGFFEPWVKEISEASDGKLEIQIFPALSLGGKPSQQADQARKGIVDIAWTLPVYTPGRYPVAETMSLPFMVTNAEETSAAMHTLMGEFGAEEYEGLKPLAFHVHAPGKFHMRDKPVTSAADLAGLRVRAPNQSFGGLLEALGAEPVFFPVTEMAPGLANGVIDGTCLPYEVVPAFKLHELTKFSSAPVPGARGLYANSFALVMNQGAFDGLSDDLKEVIEAHSGPDLSRRIGAAFDGFEKIGLGMVEKQGNQVDEIPADEVARWREASAPVYEGWQGELDGKGHDGAAVLARLNELLDQGA